MPEPSHHISPQQFLEAEGEKSATDVGVLEKRSGEKSDTVPGPAFSDIEERHLKRDKHGVLLSPQPTSDPMDPLNWPKWLKWNVLTQISLIAYLNLLSASLVTPAFVPVSKTFNRSLSDTAFVASAFIGVAGVSPFLWNPLSNVWGRRPIWLLCLAGSLAAAAASGSAQTYRTLIALRSLQGFFGGVPQALGSATVCDLFFEHERGFYMGVYTLAFISGGHSASIFGGFVERDLGSWRWCFWLPACFWGALLLLYALSVPETLYSRAPGSSSPSSTAPSAAPGQKPQAGTKNRTWTSNLFMRGGCSPVPGRKLRARDFLKTFKMARYPSVLLPAVYYGITFGYGSIIYILSSTALFAKTYRFAPWQIGLLLGLPLTLGSMVGEAFAGGLCDWVSERRAVRRGGVRKPEDRLLAIFPGVVLTPLGLVVEGVCVQRGTHYMGPAMGIAVASVGIQIVTTVIYTYTAECYKAQAALTGAILNVFRQLFGFSIGFYDLQLAAKLGVQNAWIILAMINVAFFFPVLALLWYGERWRERLGPPRFDRDL